jgi:hypothetical protein
MPRSLLLSQIASSAATLIEAINMFKRNSPRMVSRCSDANNGIRPNDGERLASLRKQLADPTQNHPVDDQKWHPTGPASSQHDDLLPQHRDLGFQRRARSEQIDDNPKNYSAEIQHPAEDRPILRLTPTGWNLRQGQRSVTIADQFGAEQRTKSVGCCCPKSSISLNYLARNRVVDSCETTEVSPKAKS